MKKIYIFDTTLRDGEQVPGAKLNTVEKITIAKQLEKLGVDIIEAGFPISSPEDFNAVKAVAKEIKNSTIAALARAVDKDIDTAYEAIKDAASPRIHTFAPTSEIQLTHILKKSQEEVIEMTRNAVTRAKKHLSNVEFSPMDASRTEFEFLIRVIETAIECGATTINVPDTVGYSMPNEWGELIRKIIERVPRFNDDIVLSVHCHNDLGFATANALAGIQNGARQVEGTINGIGERAGNTAIEEIIMAIKARYKKEYEVGINTKEIYKTSRMVSQVMGLSVQPNKAIVGANAFAHSSGIHQDGIIKKRENFEIIDPKDVGVEKSDLILTARSGRAALHHKLNELGYKISKEDIEIYYEKFMQIADQKKEIYEDDLHLLMSEFVDVDAKDQYELEQIQVLSGNKNTPMANVQIKNMKTDEIIIGTSIGSGPVDAAYKAVDDALKTKKITLKEFLVQAVTEGIDATGKVTVQVAENGNKTFGYGADADIIVASTKAYINAINKLVFKNGTKK